MHVGYAAIFQNPEHQISDRLVYQEELRLASQVEALGFESIWSVEHHFTDYTMCPDVVQFLSYMAGKTKHIKLGSMVVVLPWHDPMRVSEQISALDHLSDGRMVLGIGRGLGRIEFEGLRRDMNSSRPMFVEFAKMVLEGLEKGYLEHEGEFVKQPRRDIRPEPFKSFRGRTYAAAVSPESSRIMAHLGVGLLVVPQKPWEDVEREFAEYGKIFHEVNHAPPPPPLVAGWTFVDENADRAEEKARQYIGAYYQSVMKHYEFQAGHLKTTKGYEFYHRLTKYIDRHGGDKAAEDFTHLHPWGTPEQVYEKIVGVQQRIGNNGFVGVLSFAGMPYDEAQRNQRCFAEKVMPELKRLDPQNVPAFAAA